MVYIVCYMPVGHACGLPELFDPFPNPIHFETRPWLEDFQEIYFAKCPHLSHIPLHIKWTGSGKDFEVATDENFSEYLDASQSSCNITLFIALDSTAAVALFPQEDDDEDWD